MKTLTFTDITTSEDETNEDLLLVKARGNFSFQFQRWNQPEKV